MGGKDPCRMLGLDFWREVGGRGFWTELLRQDAKAYRVELRRATYAGKVLESKQFGWELMEQVADRVECDQRLAVARR